MGLGDYPNTIQGSLPNSRSRELQPQPQTLQPYRACALLQGCHLDFSYPNPKPTSYVASNMCASSTMSVYHRPNTTPYIALKHVCELVARCHCTPTPTPHLTQHQPCVRVQRCHYTPLPLQPHILRSNKNVCEFNDVSTPQPLMCQKPLQVRALEHACTLTDSSPVACDMCARSRPVTSTEQPEHPSDTLKHVQQIELVSKTIVILLRFLIAF